MDIHFEKFRKTFSKPLLAKFDKRYAASSRIDDFFRGKDLTMLTDDKGRVMRVYIGKRTSSGNIAGDYYIRQVKASNGDLITQSHWDKKGTVSGK